MAPAVAPSKPSLPQFCSIATAVEALAIADGIDMRGAISTRREVVNFILDLVGYTADKPLHRRRLLEPSFGEGDFLLPAIERLLAAWKNLEKEGNPITALAGSLRAIELHHETYTKTREGVIQLLRRNGINDKAASALAGQWLIRGDFLLASLPDPFDTVVGNPPYVRQELIPDVLLAEYRSRYSTIYDRADLYIPFMERSLLSLSEGGNLGFICADRWMKNRYGSRLRQLVASRFHLKIFVDMVDTPAFNSDVIAYPAITIISHQRAGSTRVAYRPTIEHDTLSKLTESLLAKGLPKKSNGVRELSGVTSGAEPWLLGSKDQRALVRRLEQAFPTIEEAGCKVGIGVATGADKAFIGLLEALDVEPDRKLPLVMTRDLMAGAVVWRGFGVINPFCDDGRLVNLEHYPRLKKYLRRYKDVIAGRHCARKAPANWYRTIDRITASLAKKPKLLIPDIKGEAHIVYEDGRLYPHHNLYYITSENWDLRALQAVLLSGIAKLFVSTYSTKMRGGYLRFQAQYLRRIRIPDWKSVPGEMRLALSKAAEAHDLRACNRVAFALYGLNKDEQATFGGSGE